MKDIVFTDGKIQLAESKHLHIQDVVVQRKGEDKFSPQTGEDVMRMVNDDDAGTILYDLRLGLKRDGAQVNRIAVEGTKLNIDANYPS